MEKSKKVNQAAIAESRCAVLQGSVADMVFANDWFDAVTAFETVYFWPDLPQCFREVYRVLKPGGTFLICNEANGDTDKDERWTKLIGGMPCIRNVARSLGFLSATALLLSFASSEVFSFHLLI